MRQSLRQTTPEIVSSQPAAIRSSQPAPQPIAPLSKPPFRGLSDELMTLQTKLTVGEVGDRFEQEADQTATRVVEQIHAPAQSEATQTAEQPQPLNQPAFRKGKNAIPALEASIHQTVGGGQTLPNALQSSMEDAFGQDFQQVRIHADAPAHQLNQSLQSRAFTTQQDIFFRQGSYDPTSRQGQELIAHELAHVVQQSANSSAPAIQRAGHKIAFEAKPTADSTDTELIEKIKVAIAAHQQSKRTAKDEIEARKDASIAKKQTQEEKVEVLKNYHEEYRETGWKLEKLKAEISKATNKAVNFPKVGNEIRITSKKTQNHLYSIFSGDQRFGSPTTQEGLQTLTNPVYKKKGTTKEYVQDQRGLYITRYVYRGCDETQMYQLFTTGKMSPRNPTMTIGDQAKRFDFGNRGEQGTLTQEEREFLQQRDGSGKDQRMLSVTHAKPNRLVHSNHGEVFTSNAVIKIDLAKIDRDKIYNQHLAESHQYKTSLRNTTRENSTERKELESYKYSAEKNRETLLVEIPKSAVVAVQMPDEQGKLKDKPLAQVEKHFAEIEKQRIADEKLAAEKQRIADEKLAAEKQRIADAKLADEKLAAQRQKMAEQRAADERSLREEKEKEEKSRNDSRFNEIKDELKVYAQKNRKKKVKLAKWIDEVFDYGLLEAYEKNKRKGGKLDKSLVTFSTLEDLIDYGKSLGYQSDEQ